MLSTHFRILTVSGVWCPVHWSSRKSLILYKLYSCFVIFFMYSLVFSQLARIIFVKQSFADFNDTFFILLSTNFACYKAANNLLKQRQIVSLIDMFKKDCCVYRTDLEKQIQKRYDASCRKIAVSLLSLVEVTALLVVAAPLFDDRGIALPYKVLLPYSLGSPAAYWLTYLHHGLGAAAFTAISITNDALVTGFMLQLCGQLELLQARLRELPRQIRRRALGPKEARGLERLLLTGSVRHHLHILQMARRICVTFGDVIVCQFCISAIEISVSVYQLSARATNILELFTYSLYLACMLGQLFVYCYFGNEVNLQSSKVSYTIFSIDWTSMSIELQKHLAMMILFSSKPITMKCGIFVRLMLDSFTSITKISYSAFNVLHTK